MATFSVIADGNGFSFNTLTPAYTGSYNDAHTIDVSGSDFTTDITATGSTGSPKYIYRPMDLDQAVKLFWTLSSVNISATATAGGNTASSGNISFNTPAPVDRLLTRTGFTQDIDTDTYTEGSLTHNIQSVTQATGPSFLSSNVTNLAQFTGVGDGKYGTSFFGTGLAFASAVIDGGSESAAEYMILSNIIQTPPSFTSTNWTVSNITLGGIPFLLGRIDLGGAGTTNIPDPTLSFH